MKQKLLNNFRLRALMLVAVLCAAFTGAWAKEASVTYTFKSKTWETFESNFDWTSGKAGNQYTTGQGVQITTSVSGANATSPISFTGITKIEVQYCTNASKGDGSIVIQIGGGTAKTFSVTKPSSGGTTLKTATFNYTTPESGNVKLTANCTTNSVYVYSVTVTYDDEAGGGTTLEDCDLEFPGQSTDLVFDLYNNNNTQQLYYITSSEGVVTISDNANDYVNIVHNEDDWTIDVTPTAVTPGDGPITVTVSQAADDNYNAGSVTFTVKVTDSTPLPAYTVTLGDDNSTLTEATGGAGVTLPTRSDVGAYTFAGWSETNVTTESTTAPTIITAGAYQPAADITLYPVYTRTTGGAAVSQVATVTIADYASANDWENGTAYQPLVMDANISVGGEISGNNFKYYTSDNSWRFYTGGSFTITASNGAELTSAKLTFSSGTLTLFDDNKTLKSGTAFDLSGTSATISCTANAKITVIEVNYTIGGSTTYYCSTPASKADPALSFDPAEATGFAGVAFTQPELSAAAGFDGVLEYESSDESVARIIGSNTGELLLVGEGTAIITATFEGDDTFFPGSASYTLTVTDNRIATTISYGPIELDVTEVETFTQLAPVVKDADNNVIDYTYEGFPPTVSYEFDFDNDPNSVISSLDNNSGEITLSGNTGTATLKAYYNQFNVSTTYKPSECTFTITVFDSHAPGAVNNPYSVAQAIDATPSSGTSDEVYISGIVSKFYAADIMNDGANYRYYISDDGTTENQLLVYKGKGLDNADFSDADDLHVGDEVVIKGKLTMYKSEAEVASGNYIVSFNRPVVPSIVFDYSNNKCDVAYTAGNTNIHYVASNLTVPVTLVICDADGNATTYDWFTADLYGDTYVPITWTANTGAARTAYFKLVAGETESPIYAVTQMAAPTITWTLADHVTDIYVFDADDQTTPLNSGVAMLDGKTVLVSPDFEDGYELDAISVVGASNNTIDGTWNDADGSYTFTMPSEAVTITVTAKEKPTTYTTGWLATTLADLTEDDVFVIVGTDADGYTYAMTNDNGTSKAPAAVYVEVNGNKLVGFMPGNLQWTVSGNATDGYTFYPYGDTENWLYTTNSNNGVRVGTNENNTFKTTDKGYLCNNATSRYVGIYNSQDWRCYTNTTGNIADQTFSFYKFVPDYTRTVTLNEAGYSYGTICMPNAGQIVGAEIYSIAGKNSEGNYLSLEKVETEMEAGKPYIFKVTSNVLQMVYTDVAVADPDNNETNGLIGSFERDQITNADGTAVKSGENPYVIKNNQICKAGTNVYVGANKAYIDMVAVPVYTGDAGNGEGGVKMFIEGGEDGIDGVAINGSAKEIYDLAGRRVIHPIRGIYIINGKKVLVK